MKLLQGQAFEDDGPSVEEIEVEITTVLPGAGRNDAGEEEEIRPRDEIGHDMVTPGDAEEVRTGTAGEGAGPGLGREGVIARSTL